MAIKPNVDGKPRSPVGIFDGSGNELGVPGTPFFVQVEGDVSSPLIASVNTGTETVTVAQSIPTAGPTAARKGIRLLHVSGAGKLYILVRNVGGGDVVSATNHIAALDVGQGWNDENLGEDCEIRAIAEAGSMVVRYEELF